MFKIHIFVASELTGNTSNMLGQFKEDYKIGVKQIPWITRNNEEIQVNYWFDGQQEKGNIVNLKGLGEQLDGSKNFSNQIKCQNNNQFLDYDK